MSLLITPKSILSSPLAQATQDLRARLETVSEETVTGRHADLNKHLNGRIGLAQLSQKVVNDIRSERDQLNLRDQRLTVIQSSLTVVQKTSNGISTSILQTTGIENDQNLKNIAREAQSALEQSFAALNANFGERFLFSGDATATPPLGSVEDVLDDIRAIAGAATSAADFNAQVETYFNDPAGGFQTTIYQGSTNVSDPDATSVLDPALTRLFTGLAVAALADPDTGPTLIAQSSEVLDQAAGSLLAGSTDVTNLRADKGTNQAEIKNRLDALDAEETLAVEAFNGLTAKDQFEAATELEEVETALEASYLLTSRLANLSLLNFLR